MTEQPSMSDLKQARVVAAMRSLAVLLMELESGKDDRLLRIINLKADLTDEERAQLLSVVLSTFPADQAERLVQSCFADVGIPITGLHKKPLADARFWAGDASPGELRAYTQACLEEMSADGRASVLKWLTRKEAE